MRVRHGLPITFGIAVSVAVVATIVAACGGDDSLSGAAFGDQDGATNPSASVDGGGTSSSGGDAALLPVGATSGVVLLHAAIFPAFRLCFQNYPEMLPQPDDTIMPEANVVGVEVGSVVRIEPLTKAPGKVYVIDQRQVQANPNDSKQKTCGELIDQGKLSLDLDYHVASTLNDPIGVGRVDLLAITGCADGARLNLLGVSSNECTGWDPTKGSLVARTVSLQPSLAASTTKLPVQLIHMSSTLEQQRGANKIDVTFGPLPTDAGADANLPALSQAVGNAPALFDASAPQTLNVSSGMEAFFGTNGFRIALRNTGNGGSTFSVDQSLADVQDLSSPQTIPTTYFLSASNYVLLLLGDPRITPKFSDGGVNPTYDPRRGVHLLAVPVKDPELEDAGSAPTIIDAGSD